MRSHKLSHLSSQTWRYFWNFLATLLAYVQYTRDRPGDDCHKRGKSRACQEGTCTCRYMRVCGWLPVGYPLGVLAQCRTQSENNKIKSEKNNVLFSISISGSATLLLLLIFSYLSGVRSETCKKTGPKWYELRIKRVHVYMECICIRHATAGVMSTTENFLDKLQCCGSGKLIPDPNFFHPGFRILDFPSRIPDPH